MNQKQNKYKSFSYLYLIVNIKFIIHCIIDRQLENLHTLSNIYSYLKWTDTPWQGDKGDSDPPQACPWRSPAGGLLNVERWSLDKMSPPQWPANPPDDAGTPAEESVHDTGEGAALLYVESRKCPPISCLSTILYPFHISTLEMTNIYEIQEKGLKCYSKEPLIKESSRWYQTFQGLQI